MEAKKQAFIAKLHELFQINNGLDFGIYRIINEKKSDIETYINNTLPNKINKFLADLQTVSVDNTAKINELETKIKTLEELGGGNADAVNKIADIKKEIAQLQQASLSGNTEEEIYDKLLTFFSRYYDEGDFISQRRYKDGVYAVPYSGEEVKLHWANNDQYYIKTGENFKDYTFNIEDNFNITFILTDAEIERDNNKSDDKKVYVLAEPSEDYEKPIYVLENEDTTKAELFIRLSYRYGKDIKQKESSEAIINAVKQLENDNEISSNIKSKIKNLFKSRDEKDKNKESHLEYHLNKYIAKNSFDFFIHKDLKKFLMQELDFYIKNEVIYLQDLYGSIDSSDILIMNVKKAGVIQNIGSEIITFLAQLEDFQKELYLKKKFVTETNYCITLDKINEKYYDEIIANKAQLEEWKKLFAIDEIEGDLHTKAFSDPLSKDFLKENKYLVLDTAFFSEEFKEKIIADIENLDENIDGLLIHGDNFQALNLMQEKYKEQVQCVYIDPPYNTDNNDFNYKDNYKHSSWLAMMNDRLAKMKQLMNDESAFFSSIDDNEVSNLKILLSNIFGSNNFLNTISVKMKNIAGASGGGEDKKIKKNIEYLHVFTNRYELFKPFKNIATYTVLSELLEYYRENNISWKYTSILLNQGTKKYLCSAFDSSGNTIKIYEHQNFIIESVNSLCKKECSSEYEIYKKYYKQIFTTVLPQSSIRPRVIKAISELGHSGELFSIEYIPKSGRNKGNVYQQYYKGSKLRLFAWLNDVTEMIDNDLYKKDIQGTLWDFTGNINNLTKEGDVYFPNGKKPLSLVKRIVEMQTLYDSLILDFFAGSGTTGHAVINLNREDNGKRKYILVEMGEYFDTVTKPRIEKVIYSKDWKDGKPVSREGSSHIFKYIRLESYEDTLNNVEFSKSFDIDDFLQNEYLTKYKIKKETEGSSIYLPAEVFYNPFEFQLKITRKNESRVQKIDLIETFNFLIGLKVNSIYTKRYNAEFKTMEHGRLHADIKLDNNGQYIFKIVEGSTLKGEKVLVIWRNIVGNINNNDDLNKNNAVLESVTLKNQIKPADSEYDIIYINCTNSLQNFAKEGSYKVVLIEEVMKDKMFNGI